MTPSKHHVLITGASRGLGRRIADRFWDAGDDLILVARSEKGLRETATECEKTSKRDQTVSCFEADLSDPDQIPSLIGAIRKEAGEPDTLINNAAIQGPIGPFHTNSWSEWQACLNVCLMAPVQICRELLPSMIERRFGRIVNISGGGAASPRPNFSSYATAKCGLVRFSETLAHEVGVYGITVNCVAPGAMASGLTECILEAGEECAGPAEIGKALLLKEENPHSEERAADLVHFLTTEKCAGINGKLISAVWDPWENLPGAPREIMESDVYTLRRILPKERDLTFE